MTDSAERTPPSGQHTAAHCLAVVAHHHGIGLTPERLVHEFALGESEPGPAVVVKMAQAHGLKARTRRVGFDELARLEGVFPVIARLANGNSVIVAGVRPAGIDALSGEEKGATRLRQSTAPTVRPAHIHTNSTATGKAENITQNKNKEKSGKKPFKMPR